MTERQSFEPSSSSRDRATLAALLFALAAGPAAWIIQLVFTYGMANYACQPVGAPGLRPLGFGWEAERLLFLGVNLACMALVLVGGGLAYRGWRLRRRDQQTNAGETRTAGHIGFLAASGMMAAAGFAIAILFNTVEIFMIPACWRIAP